MLESRITSTGPHLRAETSARTDASNNGLVRQPLAPTAEELLRAAEADLLYFQRAARVGAATKSDVGLAAERLLKLQIAYGRPPRAQPLAVESARQT